MTELEMGSELLATQPDIGLLRAEVDRLAADEKGERRGGVRSLLAKSVLLREWAESGPPALLARFWTGPGARTVKATLLDKTSEANWKVPWHQDLTIAVREQREVDGFGPWTVKDGVAHVQPPVSVLERMIAVRVHLDDTLADHGALRVVPGSHRFGRLSKDRAAVLRQELGETVCPVSAGGVMAMRPLLLHASSPAVRPGRRRVIHVEYAFEALPGGLQWP